MNPQNFFPFIIAVAVLYSKHCANIFLVDFDVIMHMYINFSATKTQRYCTIFITHKEIKGVPMTAIWAAFIFTVSKKMEPQCDDFEQDFYNNFFPISFTFLFWYSFKQKARMSREASFFALYEIVGFGGISILKLTIPYIFL